MKNQLNLLMERMTEINRKNLEDALEIERESIEKGPKSEQLKIDLISTYPHDLKTPLTSMVGYIELMKKRGPGRYHAGIMWKYCLIRRKS